MAEATGEPEPPEPPNPRTDKPEASRNRALDWFSKNPVFGLASFVLSIVSVTATILLGLVPLKSRDLSLTINPTTSTIVKSGKSSDLLVLYIGLSVSTDVTALQVRIWNAGKESIHPEQILSPVILQTSPKVAILEVRLRHVTRPVSQIRLDESQLGNGRVGMSWRILDWSGCSVYRGGSIQRHGRSSGLGGR